MHMHVYTHTYMYIRNCVYMYISPIHFPGGYALFLRRLILTLENTCMKKILSGRNICKTVVKQKILKSSCHSVCDVCDVCDV